ncbi:MAG: DUF3017 domain-containing protein [Propionibacteriaceae bacterium]|jgi:hypothetical protein|nr:DUF3017 domain-containing protein [Propionibacteriaceae bacterium]
MTSPSTDSRPPKTVVQQIIGQWPLATVLVGVLVGLVIAVPLDHWRIGSTLIGLSVTLGGLLRLLPQQRVGLLAVRSRLIDTILLLGSGLGILLLSWIVPPTAR